MARVEKRDAIRFEDTIAWKRYGPLIVRGAQPRQILEIVRASNIYPDTGKKGDEDTLIGRINDTFLRARNKTYSSQNNPIEKVDLGQKNREYPMEEEDPRRTRFVVAMFKNGFIPLNVACAQEMIDFCKANKIVLPENFYDKVRLEMFFGAITLDLMGDCQRFSHYVQLGNGIDAEWFFQSLGKEEDGIRQALQRKHSSKPISTPWLVGIDEETGVMFDNLKSAVLRQRSRWGIERNTVVVHGVNTREGRRR